MTDAPVVVVTGGTRGIGRALAHTFVARGCSVVVCGVDHGRLAAIASDLPTVLAVACDVSVEREVRALWDAAVERFGRVDIWINNAGRSHERLDVTTLSDADARAVVDVNLIGTIVCSRVAIERMRAQGGGAVYATMGLGSNGSSTPGLAVYGATKYALRYLTDRLIEEVEGSAVRVGSISPGVVDTDLLGVSIGQERAREVGADPMAVAAVLVDQLLSDPPNGAAITAIR